LFRAGRYGADSLVAPLLTPSLFDGAKFLEIFILACVAVISLTVGDMRRRLRSFLWRYPVRVRLILSVLSLLASASTLHARFPMHDLAEISLSHLPLLFASGCAVLSHEKKDFTGRIFTSSLMVGALAFLIIFA